MSSGICQKRKHVKKNHRSHKQSKETTKKVAVYELLCYTVPTLSHLLALDEGVLKFRKRRTRSSSFQLTQPDEHMTCGHC